MANMTGGCQCGKLRYEIGATPLGAYACHCTQCQTQSGSAFGESLIVARPDFRIVEGEARVYARTTERGTVTLCHYCEDCGTRVMHERQGNQTRVTVKPGTLDDTSGLELAGHMWVSSAQPWLRPLLKGPLVFEEQPADISVFMSKG
jgi:hypothetical protein